MNKFRNFLSVAVVMAGTLFFISCDENNDIEKELESNGVVVVNEGNFGAGNGSISLYSEDSLKIANNVVKNANSGSEIGSLVQSVYAHDGVGYIICNASDKIEFISMEDNDYLANPETDVSAPRYMTVAGDMGYISCWGPWGANYDLPNSYVAVLDLTTRKIIDSLDCSSGPEGIIAVGNNLYVANSYDTTITIIDLADETSSVLKLNAAPLHFANDGSGSLWVTLGSAFKHAAVHVGLQEINISDNSLGVFVQVSDLSGSGKMAIDGSGENIYVLTAQPYPSTATEVFAFNISTKTLGNTALISGENFYGIGVNPDTDMIYVGDSKAFAGSGKIYVYDQTGIMVDEQTASIAPNGFLFN